MAREVMGGNGLVTDYHVGKQFVDLEAVHTFEGSYDVNTLYVHCLIWSFSFSTDSCVTELLRAKSQACQHSRNEL